MLNSNKVNPVDVYNYILKQFNVINGYDSFVNFTMIQPNELIRISNITLDCVDKLSKVSILYIQKLYDLSLSVITMDQLNKVIQINDKLIDKLYKFSRISVDSNNIMKDIKQYDFDIIIRYKLLILQIIDIIKSLNNLNNKLIIL
jgi:hypothetical protein